MTELRLETYEMPAARLGPVNPLAPLTAPGEVATGVPEERRRADESVPPEDRKHFGYGAGWECLPYRLQDDYDRARRGRAFRAAVLENDRLRATFLTELGGRLWSLVHKPRRGPPRELLYVNPVFQPRNLAIRNAWFSGGVEWNGCQVGHSVFTCSPVFAARFRAEDGSPALRLYEWHRVREAPFQIDFFLPDGSDFLFSRVRLANPHDTETPVCWWSNTAFPETPGVRVLAPADRAFHHDYAAGITLEPLPVVGGVDRTYPANMVGSGDCFFRVEEGRRPWIAAVDGEGRGLVQAATRRLIGRKLFVWGTGRGGRRWQEFLSEPGNPYIEIQAGLTRTQSECLPMPAGAEWTWLEAFGPVEADAGAVHGPDWRVAWGAVEECLDEKLPQDSLEGELARTAPAADRPPEEIFQHGSGWGALERVRRERAGEKPFSSPALVFDDDSLGEEQEPWLELLGHGELPRRDPGDQPGAYMIQREWRALLEDAVREGRGDHWLSWQHLGVMRYHAGETEGAGAAWQRSEELEPSAWASRNLAVLAREEGRPADAADLARKARLMAPDLRPLAVECCRFLLEADRPRELLDVLRDLPPEVRDLGRLRVLEAAATFRAGDLDGAERMLRKDMDISDIREGETILTELWFAVHAKRLAGKEGVALAEDLYDRVERECPPPAHIDFRMSKATKKAHPDMRRLWRKLVE